MTNFLNRMAARAIGAASVARPFVPARFSPTTGLIKSGVAGQTALEESATVEAAPDPVGRSVTQERSMAATPFNEGKESASSRSQHLMGAAVPETWGEEDRDRSLPPFIEPASPPPLHKVSSSLQPLLPATNVVDQTSPTSLEPDPEVIEDERITTDSEPLPLSSGSESRPAATALRLGSTTPVSPGAFHARRGQAGEFNSDAPVIRVSIGRIDVRAQFPSAPSPAPARTPRTAALSLDEYLKQRREGKR